MRAVFVFCAVALLLANANSQESRKSNPADRNAFTFLNWDLEIRIETKTESLFVRGKVVLRNDSAQPQRQVPLQLSSSLKWASIKQNGKPVPFSANKVRSDVDHTGNIQEAVVTLSSPVAPAASLELEVGYSGTVTLDTTRLAQLGVPLHIRLATDYDRISPTFTCLRGVGHVLWFPVSLDPALMTEGNRVFEEGSAWTVRQSLSTMRVILSTDLGQPTRSNAQLDRHEDVNPASSQELQWKHFGLSGPVLAAGSYQTITARQERGSSAFTIDFFADHSAEAQDYARVIRDTPALITGKPDFPVSFIELPEPGDSAFDADTIFLTSLKTTDRKSLEVTVAYMLTHQTLWSPRAWIYVGAAHLAQALTRERQDGRAAAINFMEQRLPPLGLADSGAPELAKSNSLVNATSEVFYRTKAMYVWWMLREIVGQRSLLDSLQQYDPAADTEPSYIQKLIEKNSHKDLEWFFDDWVYQDRGLPEFTVSNGYARPSLQGIFLVSATIENKGAATAEVPVIVHTQNGDVASRLRVPAHGKTATRIEVGSQPIEIMVNDGSVPEVDRSDNRTAIRIGAQ